MTAPLDIAAGALLLFLMLVLASLASSLVLRLLGERLRHPAWAGWLADNETALLAAVWAGLALAAYYLGPRLMPG